MIKKIAFKIVYKELLKHRLFCGNYSGNPRTENFMYGVSTAIETIAYLAGDYSDKYAKMFLDNMSESEKRWEELNGKQGEVSEDLS